MSTPKKIYKYKTKKNGKNQTGCPVKWTPDAIQKLGEEYLIYVKTHPTCITQGEFFNEKRMISNDAVRYIKSLSPEFSRLINCINDIYEDRLINFAVDSRKTGKNPNFIVWLLKNKHGWMDKSETKITNETLNINFEELNNESSTSNES